MGRHPTKDHEGRHEPKRGTKDLEVLRQRNQRSARLMVAIERLSNTLNRHVDILYKGRCESAVTEKEAKRELPGSKKGSKFRFSQANISVTLLLMNRSSIYFGAFCLGLQVIRAELEGGFRHALSQAVSPWCAQSIRTTEVLSPSAGNRKALAENPHDGTSM